MIGKPRIRHFLVVALWAAFVSGGAAWGDEDPVRTEPLADRIQRLIQQLGAPSFRATRAS